MKIFELAKEHDMSSLDLVELLKGNGFAVRNHMSKLSDEELEKAKALLSAPADEGTKEKAKTTKKKTVRKKVSKASATETGKDKKVVKKKVVKKKSTVIRRKAGSATEETTAADPSSSELTSSEVAASTTTEQLVVKNEKTSEQTKLDEEVTTSTTYEAVEKVGLQVVSRPKIKKEEMVETPDVVAEEKPIVNEKEYYEEKVHKFTPVYIPTEEEIKAKAQKKKEEQASAETASENVESGPSYDDGTAKKKTEEASSKKRIGGLASMMSSKKSSINRSQLLNEERTETELKSYAALNSLGRPLYSQIKKKKSYSGPSESTLITEVKDSKRIVNIHKFVKASDLSQKLSQKFENFRDQCLDLNLLVSKDDMIGLKLATEIAALYGYRVEDKAFNEDVVIGKKSLSEEEKSKLPLRNPIITIMGHVDHGKTTLLDYIREAKVVEGEAGGITQHIGAYSVNVNDKVLTFLDTPGHAAFASMRQRGADVTDIVVLVVAADDGVMPQTRESIKFCKNANCPIIVAVNKMDKEGANPDRIKQALTEYELTPEEWGGDTQYVPISALKGDGVDELLESIALQSEMMELRSNPKGHAEGVVIESRIEAGRGPVATILVQSGTLKKGDSLVVGECFGRARSLMEHTGKNINSAGPSTPVQILGLNNAPSPGDVFNVVKNEREAKKIVSNRESERKTTTASPAKKKVSLEDFFGSAAPEGESKELNIIVRSDVNGTYEAIKQSLEALSNDEVTVKVIGGGVGAINDNDVRLADGASAYIFGFNMRPINTARRLAENLGVEVKTYSIIYELINDVKLAIEGLLEPESVEEFIGRAEVRDTFTVPKIGTIAGSYVIDGKIQVGCGIRLLRSGKILHDGKLSSLKRFKDDVKEVKHGFECGIGLENYNDIKIGDVFEAYMMVERKRKYDEIATEQVSHQQM